MARTSAKELMSASFPGSNGLAQEAAIDADIGAGDEAAGLGAGQEDRGADQLALAAEARHRGVAEDLLGARRRAAILVEQQAAVLLGRKEAGGQRIDPHAVLGPLAGD